MAPEDWVVGAVTTLAGLLLGLSTGFYFESRQTRRARAESDELREANGALTTEVADLKDQLRRLNLNLTSTRPRGSSYAGVTVDEGPEAAHSGLVRAVLEYIALHLDASGTVARGRIFEHFTRTHPSTQVAQALTNLIEAGTLEVLDGNRIRIRP